MMKHDLPMIGAIVLAQLPTPTPSQLMSWLGCLGFVLLIVNQGFKLWQNLAGRSHIAEISPQPLEIRQATEFVRKLEFHETRDGIAHQIQQINNQLQEARGIRITDAKDAASSRRLLHEEVKIARKDMLQHTENVRRELSDKIDNIPDRVIATLKNTGAI